MLIIGTPVEWRRMLQFVHDLSVTLDETGAFFLEQVVLKGVSPALVGARIAA